MRIPFSVSSTITFVGLSRPYLRAVSIGIINVADRRPLKNVCVTFFSSDITDDKYIRSNLSFLALHE